MSFNEFGNERPKKTPKQLPTLNFLKFNMNQEHDRISPSPAQLCNSKH